MSDPPGRCSCLRVGLSMYYLIPIVRSVLMFKVAEGGVVYPPKRAF